MKNIIIPITIIIVSIILGGFYYITQIQEQRFIERQKEITIETATEVKKAEMQLEIDATEKFIQDSLDYVDNMMKNQEKCSESASDYFRKSEYKPTHSLMPPLVYDYFNEELKKCFVVISGSKVETIRSIEVAEVYENKIYGIYSSQRGQVITCRVLNKSCRDKDEFLKLLKPYHPFITSLLL